MQATTSLPSKTSVSTSRGVRDSQSKRSSRSAQRRAIRLGLLFVSPWIIGFCAFFAYPFFATIYYSFTDFNGVGAAKFIGLTNYVNLFHDPLFRTSLFNTFYYTAIELPLSTGVGPRSGPPAQHEGQRKGRLPDDFLYPIDRAAHRVMHDLRLDFQPHLRDRQRHPDGCAPSRPELVFLHCLVQTIIHIAGALGPRPADGHLLGGPPGRAQGDVRGGRLDGASPWQRLRHVTVPMISPVILFTVILQLVLCVSYFTQAQVIENGQPGGPGTSTWFYVQYLYVQAFQFLKFGYSSAMAFFLFVISAIIMVLLFKSSSRWVYYASEQQ